MSHQSNIKCLAVQSTLDGIVVSVYVSVSTIVTLNEIQFNIAMTPLHVIELIDCNKECWTIASTQFNTHISQYTL